MKFTIKSEQNYRCPAPKITEEMITWFWNEMVGVINRHSVNNFIEKLEVRVQQSYNHPTSQYNFFLKIHKEYDIVLTGRQYEFDKFKYENIKTKEIRQSIYKNVYSSIIYNTKLL